MEKNAPDFERHVQPTLTRLGCNSGSCHGALAGKGGFRLFLRGYNGEADHHAIIEHLLGRIANILQPSSSLLLLKPLNKISHGGGKKLREGSLEHKILLAWIKGGELIQNYGLKHRNPSLYFRQPSSCLEALKYLYESKPPMIPVLSRMQPIGASFPPQTSRLPGWMNMV